jgi:hypothetical protein
MFLVADVNAKIVARRQILTEMVKKRHPTLLLASVVGAVVRAPKLRTVVIDGPMHTMVCNTAALTRAPSWL